MDRTRGEMHDGAARDTRVEVCGGAGHGRGGQRHGGVGGTEGERGSQAEHRKGDRAHGRGGLGRRGEMRGRPAHGTIAKVRGGDGHGAGRQVRGGATHETRGKVRGDRASRGEDKQARVVEGGDTPRWKMASVRLGHIEENAEERGRLLLVVAGVGGDILQGDEDDLTKVVWRLEVGLMALHIDPERVTKVFGEQHNIDPVSLWEKIARVGVPVNIGPGNNLERKLAYANHSSADRHAIELWDKVVGDVKTGRETVVPVRLAGIVGGLRVNAVGFVNEKGKKRITFGSIRRNESHRRAKRGRPVNKTTYSDHIRYGT